ncbi:type II toxin-antitoxin system Phd/YefM family antitoxin [Agromyces aerolatus]|uniref:type II toxin-antitoxin system Phd/YefM family antitoxin n=1 Tax=Agromyces sp. LY-1074 TaxID=3074080 RepID=UPI002867710B|nr:MULTISPECIES: type II toxin-antitoxin system Phd/YefM family antitoxin [unclassified Agromyces]MDR5701957.1 type II toxin-antitoxin system Phd/YefM family antitoxin [Agromyces sp. LY-1074]MDR5708184.1 type II toxin-antitoxin system Phd/YefM family antitoxin [Agromyces sp. LY-1358]
MVAVNSTVSTRELRDDLAGVLGRAAYGHERVGVTRHGKLAAVVIGVEDLEALEAYEMARDVAELRAAKRHDDGGRVSLEELRSELSE